MSDAAVVSVDVAATAAVAVDVAVVDVAVADGGIHVVHVREVISLLMLLALNNIAPV